MFNSLEAKCPLCGRVFVVLVEYEWTGRGKPRMHCAKCKWKIKVGRFQDHNDTLVIPPRVGRDEDE